MIDMRNEERLQAGLNFIDSYKGFIEEAKSFDELNAGFGGAIAALSLLHVIGLIDKIGHDNLATDLASISDKVSRSLG